MFSLPGFPGGESSCYERNIMENIVLIRQKNIRELIMYWIRFTKKDAGQQLYQTRLIMQ